MRHVKLTHSPDARQRTSSLGLQADARLLAFGGGAADRGNVGQVAAGGFKQAHADNRIPDSYEKTPLARAVAKPPRQPLGAVL